MSTVERSVSVVIVVRDAPELEQTLLLLKEQVERSAAECLVVDGSVTRMTAIAERHPWVRWIDYPTPLDGSFSIPGQRNAGIRAARGRIIAFIDAGCEPGSDWLTTLTAPLRADREQITCGPIRSLRPGVYTVVNDLPDGSVVAPAPTGNLAFSRAVIDRIGGFDERFTYGSDTDWTLRAAEAGIAIRLVRSAEVGLDFGPDSLTIRRSFRYGRGRTRMLRLHPRRIAAQLRRQPDYVIYPAYLLAAPVALLVGFFGSPLFLLAYLGLLAVPLLRHRTHPAPGRVVLDHLIQGAGVLVELLSLIFPSSPVVLHFPFDPGPYQGPLTTALREIGVRSAVLRGATPFQSLNVLLLPCSLLSARLRGTRILHLHWVWGFAPGATMPHFMRRVTRAYFGFLLRFARWIGLSIVWTAHNLLPHRQVFDNDVAGRRTLLRAADAVVVHHPATADELTRRFGALPPVVVAPQGGADLPPLPEREVARTELGIERSRLALVFTGRILPYKGLLELFAALQLLSRTERARIALRIAGEPEPVAHRHELESAAAALPDLDLSFEWERISDARYAAYLAAADLTLFPFRSITNSGSVITALSAGAPALIAGHPTLAVLPEPAVLRYAPERGVEALAAALRTVLGRSDDDWAAARHSAAAFAAGATWTASAQRHRELYASLLEGGR